MNEHIPDIETYIKRLNWYLQEHYPANKKITAEEWNALFLALMNQGNAQEDTLEKICNEILPPHVTAINHLLDAEVNFNTHISSLEDITAEHSTRINILEVDALDSKERIKTLENTTDNHNSRIKILEVASENHNERINTLENASDYYAAHIASLENLTTNHENRLSSAETTITEHSSKLNSLDDLTKQHTTQITGLRNDVDSNAARLGVLEPLVEQKSFKTETVLKYNIGNIPNTVTYAKNGIKDLLIEFYGETYVVPTSFNTTESRTGSVLVTDVKNLDNGDRVQTEVFKFKEGIVTRQIISNAGTLTYISDWIPINDAYLVNLDERATTNTTDIANIKRDYATNAVVNSKEAALQNQITANRTDIDTILGDYVKKADNLNIDYLTKNELSVSDTGALIQTERLKNITKGTTSNPRQSTPIPVVDNKARLFLPQEIASLRDLVSWKNSLLGEALNYIVDFSDFPTNPNAQELQAYLNNKWAALGGTLPIIDQTTMTDESIPLSYRWYVNENAWIYSHGVSDNIATNNLYNEQGTLVTPGSTGKVLGSNKKFHIMYETNGEGTVVGLDALEQTTINNTADISEVGTSLTDYKNSNNTRVKAIEDRATNLESRATTIEGILPTKLDKITNTLNMQGLYGRKADGTHNLLGADSNNTAGSIMLRDSNGNAHISTPTAATHIVNKKYVDDASAVLDTAISDLTTALNTEKDTRANADSALSTRITTEETTRANADSALQTKIDTLETNVNNLSNNKMDKVGSNSRPAYNGSDLAFYSDIQNKKVTTKTGRRIWITKTWNGLTYFSSNNIWTDGENIYYSYDNTHCVLDKATSTWITKTWNGLTNFFGGVIWTDGENIYYSERNKQYVLDKATSTWSPKTWNGLTEFSGYNIWTDGDNIYYSDYLTQYVFDIDEQAWKVKTWNGLTNFYCDYVWTDGENIYYSTANFEHYVLDKATSTWKFKMWNGLEMINGSNIWTDGTNIYYSYDSYHYVLKDYIISANPILNK